MAVTIKKQKSIAKKKIAVKPKQVEQKSIVIAIDGLAGAGKGTLGRRLATELGFDFLDTGSLYRVVAYNMVNMNGNIDNEKDIEFAIKSAKKYMTPELLEQPELRTEKVSSMASKVAVNTKVRGALLEEQQTFASNPPEGRGAILDGRDIGTVVCPKADIKLFITASPEIRAERRFKEMQTSNKNISYEQILSDMKERDARDASREMAPAKPADDAIIIDTSDWSIEEAFAKMLDAIRNHMIIESKIL